MTSLFRNTFIFVVSYLVLMAPTYVLPWLGSNSAIFNVVGAAVGHGMTPQWWLHAWCLAMLILMTWLRGNFIGKEYLSAFPFFAAVFDMTPGLSMIPLVPSALHLATIMIGIKVGAQPQIDDGAVMSSGFGSTTGKVGVLAGLMTIAAISGSVFFMNTSKNSLSGFGEQESGTAIKSIPAKLKSPLPIVAPTPAKAVVASPIVPEKFDMPPTPHIDNAKRSASNTVKRKHVQKKALIRDQNATKDVGEVRYININE